jgi:dihydropteroate synthase
MERVRWRVGTTLLPERAWVMGVVNVTPDSFSDGGAFRDAEAAIAHGVRLAEEGAEVLDIGGESTRPGGGVYGAGMQEVPEEEEIARVVPVIRGLVRAVKVPISIDTRKLGVARAALDAGAAIINDVTGLQHAPELAVLAVERAASLCLMHARGSFASMQKDPRYDDVVAEVARFLEGASAVAIAAGVPRERICVDPGLGFGKTLEHNLALLHALPTLAALGFPVLVGASRKGFIGALTGVKGPGDRLGGSIGAAVAAVLRGASGVRVHEVRQTVEALRVSEAIARGRSAE